MDDPAQLGITFAKDVATQLISLSTGILALSTTLHERHPKNDSTRQGAHVACCMGCPRTRHRLRYLEFARHHRNAPATGRCTADSAAARSERSTSCLGPNTHVSARNWLISCCSRSKNPENSCRRVQDY